MAACSHMQEFAQDPDVPVSYDDAVGGYRLDLSSSLAAVPAHCFFCGGHGFPGKPSGTVKCSCGRLQQAAADPALPVLYDAETNEFRLRVGDGELIMYHCPFCGGSMPASKRGALFTEPEPREMGEIQNRLRGAQTIADVISRLGEPDRRLGPAPPVTFGGHTYPGSKENLVYTSLGQTLDVEIQEQQDGSISVCFSGKWKQKPGSPKA
jgi:hypothetical protein